MAISISAIVLGILSLLLILLAIVAVLNAIYTVRQGTVAVITRFGEFKKISTTGLNFKVPFIDSVQTTISLQNRAAELQFQAITSDQANVHFKAMILYSALDNSVTTIKDIAFKFRSEAEFQNALSRTTEGSVRAFVAGKKQSEVLTLRRDIVDHVKGELDVTLNSWGYHLQDLQINDITFDNAVMESMSQVVASSNLRAAAENKGQALLIEKTKAAEANGKAIQIEAEAEKEAARLRGMGVAQFREEVAKGMANASEQMKSANLDVNVIMFSMWTEAIKNFAEVGKGNMLFLDGSPSGMETTMRQIQGMLFAAKDGAHDGNQTTKPLYNPLG